MSLNYCEALLCHKDTACLLLGLYGIRRAELECSSLQLTLFSTKYFLDFKIFSLLSYVSHVGLRRIILETGDLTHQLGPDLTR